MQLTSNVYVETGFRGANVGYVTTGDGIVMIDTPFRPTDAVTWRKEVESKGQISYLINTEHHRDHVAGNFFFTAPVVAHDKTREEMLALDVKYLLEILAVADPEGISLVNEYRLKLPSVTFSERLTLYVGKHSFHLIHLPGHTLGETAVFVPQERVVFTGDNIVYREQGFLHEADPFCWQESLKQIRKLDVDYLVPGHGEVCDKSYIGEQEDYIQECIDTVRKALDRGWTKEEFVDRVSLPQRYPLQAGNEEAGRQMLRMSVSRLYDLLSS